MSQVVVMGTTPRRAVRERRPTDLIKALAREGIPQGPISRALMWPQKAVESAIVAAYRAGEIRLIPPVEYDRDAIERALRRRIEEAEGAIEAMRQAQEARVSTEDLALPATLAGLFGLRPTGAKILSMLFRGEIVSREGLYLGLYGNRNVDARDPKVVDTHICLLRGHIRQFWIQIKTILAVGYRLTDASKLWIGARLAEVKELGLDEAARRLASGVTPPVLDGGAP